MKKIHILILMLSFASIVKAQTNIQEMYDFNRKQLTTTLEMFKADNWGSTFFFVDIYHPKAEFPTDFYSEISRSLNFWQNTKLKDLSLHAEWNGGCGTNVTSFSYGVNNAWLFGAEYLIHTADYQNTLTLQVLYKNIRHAESKVPMQFTAVWGCNDIFDVKGLNFSGFADFWWETCSWANPDYAPYANLNDTELAIAQFALQLLGQTLPPEYNYTTGVFITEPQLWYNVGQHFGCDNLNIGGEVEISNNFTGNGTGKAGWVVNPAIGLKWVF